jgi:flagellar assembly protein FliH
LSKFPRTNILRAVRLLPDTVKIGSRNPGEDERPESATSPHLQEETSSDEILELQNDVDRLATALERAERENRDLSARYSLYEKEIAREREKLATERKEIEAAQRAEYETLRKKAAAEGKEQGIAAGYAEGLEKARKEISLEYEKNVSSLVSLLENIHAALDAHAEELAALQMPRLVRLWEMMLSKMLHREARVSRESVLPILRSLLERLSDRDRILVYLNPEDIEIVTGRKDAFSDLLRGVKHLEFIPDGNVGKGSCIVETNLGIYDARWSTQLEQIHREIDHFFIEGRKDDDE